MRAKKKTTASVNQLTLPGFEIELRGDAAVIAPVPVERRHAPRVKPVAQEVEQASLMPTYSE